MESNHLFEGETEDGGIVVDVHLQDEDDDGNPTVDVKLRDKHGRQGSFYFEIQDGRPILRVWTNDDGDNDPSYTIDLWWGSVPAMMRKIIYGEE
jgi:hypothetical protein